jgi:branched-chain amino acid transport system ATP-binding protein
MLKTENLVKQFGGLIAVNNVTLEIEKGEIFGLIGPNGAGKSTFINTITGVYQPNGGRVFLKDKDISNLSPEEVCHRGMARTFQTVRSFHKMTVLENVMVGAIFGGERISTTKAREKAMEMLDFVEFNLSLDTLANNLNTTQLKRVELARILATNCDLLLMDEVAAGLTPGELPDFIDLIRKIRNSGITIMVIEHLMKLIMGVCDRIAVLNFGELIGLDTPQEISRNKKVIDAYLG